MLKKLLSIILLVVFVNFIVAPTVISLVDNDIDVSMVFNLNEEEKKENESEKDQEIKLHQVENLSDSLIEVSGKIVNCCYKNYTKHYIKLHVPPPEHS